MVDALGNSGRILARISSSLVPRVVWWPFLGSAMSPSASYQPLGFSILPYPLTDSPLWRSGRESAPRKCSVYYYPNQTGNKRHHEGALEREYQNSLEPPQGEARGTPLPRTWMNRGKKRKGRALSSSGLRGERLPHERAGALQDRRAHRSRARLYSPRVKGLSKQGKGTR